MNNQDEIKVRRATKEDKERIARADKIRKDKQDELDLLVRSKVSAEGKKQIAYLNVLQVVFVILAIVAEILSEKGIISELVSMVAVLILIASIVVIMIKINRITNKKK